MPANLDMVIDTLAEAKESIFHVLESIKSTIKDALHTILSAIKFVFKAFWYKCLLPVGMTGLNVLGYFGDKIILGPPGLRKYFDKGVIPSDIPESYRNWVKNNAGWDIYTRLDGIPDNVIGFVLGFGGGLLNYLSHLISSIGHNIHFFFNLLGSHGVFGQRQESLDERNIPVRIIFGLITAPIVLPVVVLTNLVNGVLTFGKHLGLSFLRNTRAICHLLGDNGVFGKQSKLQDDRHIAVKVIFGILTAPVVGLAALVTNGVDGILASLKNAGMSIGYNVHRTFNLLGENGVMGKRREYQDPRPSKAAKIIFGAITFPVVFPISFVTNAVDGILAFLKNAGMSIGYNVHKTFNLLGEYGVMGKRREYQDPRPSKAARIIFGAITFPIVFPISFVTNSMDGILAFLKNAGQSIGYNVHRTFNLLGENGVMGKRREYQDPRPSKAARIIFGVITFPIVLPISFVTNTVDGILAFLKNAGMSIGYNVHKTFNLLGENGVMGKRREYQDPRPSKAARIIFGAITFPVVFPISLVTNAVDGILAFLKNAGMSIGYNVHKTFNLLGENGVMGKRREYQDPRPSKAAQIIFGVITFPIVFPISFITNTVDGILAFLKNAGMSIGYNVHKTFNLLGENGVMGKRREYQDPRPSKAVRIIFGAITFPIVLPISFVTNTVDGILAFLKNAGMSIGYNVHRTFNLLGEYGVMGKRREYQDPRPSKAARIIFGVITFPIVFPISFVTNLVDGLLTFCSNARQSIWYNVHRTFNLLGENGVMGKRREYQDPRPSKAVRIIFGAITFPIVFPISLVTNAVDGLLTFLKNAGQSIGYNVHRTFNLLGENGVMGKRREYQDPRPSKAARIIFGAITFPIVFPITFVTNTVDGLLAFLKNAGQSIGYNVHRTFNLLGENGVMGKRREYQDPRPSKAARIIFGAITFPIVLPISFVTNTVDGLLAFVKNATMSIDYNVDRTFNLLGEYGVMGKRREYKDPRPSKAARIIFGIITFPVVFPITFVSNAVDVLVAFLKNAGQSIGYNVHRTFNLLGENGVMGKRREYQDPRPSKAARIIFGAITFPIVLPISLVTNTVDGLLAFLKNAGQSIGYNVHRTFNLLGEYGVMGMRREYQDPRPSKAARIIFGAITFPVVFPISLVTNAIDGILAFLKNAGQSIGYNVHRTFNLLDEYGVMGKRREYQDPRPSKAARIIFGAITLPIVLPISLVTNAVDGILAFLKNAGKSIGYNVHRTFNLLGENGVMGKRREYQDQRNKVAKIIFGVTTFPIVLPISLVTNAVDGILAFLKNAGQSIGYNVHRTFNLLGEYGMMGKRRKYQDPRPSKAARIFFGILTAPIVVIVSFATNICDIVATALKHTLFNKKFWQIALAIGVGVPVVAITALPFFLLRKTIKGFYNFTLRPCIEKGNDHEFNGKNFASGVANFATLGAFSILKKAFKAATGYTKRFGFPEKGDVAQGDAYKVTMKKFKDGIHLAATGKFPGFADDEGVVHKDGQGIFRPLMRLCYRMRYVSEKVIKEYHNAYLNYVSVNKGNENPDLSINGFFASQQARDAGENAYHKIAKQQEKNVVNAVENYLRNYYPQLV